MSDQRLALLDWDGTLRRPFTIIAWYRFLSTEGGVGTNPEVPADKLQGLYDRHRSQPEDYTYEVFAKDIVDAYAEGMKGVDLRAVLSLSDAYARSVENELFSIAKPVLEQLRLRGLDPFVITGSPLEAVQAECDYGEFKVSVRGTILEVQEGRYTGSVQINGATAKSKRTVVQGFIQNGAKVAISFGDSNSDKPLMVGASVQVVESAESIKKLDWTPTAYLPNDSSAETVETTLDAVLGNRATH